VIVPVLDWRATERPRLEGVNSNDYRIGRVAPIALLDRQLYKALIDALVAECLTGQGQIASTRVQVGMWNTNASADHLADQHDLNVLFAQLSADDRSTLASMVSGEFVAGVHAFAS
jgi:hypothetical protein